MSHVLTLIGPAGSGDLIEGVLKTVRQPLGSQKPPFWLAPDRACDILFDPASDAALAAARQLVESAIGAHPIDAGIQPVEGRRKRLLVADMDSTIIEQECLDEIAKVGGIGPKIAAITERAMRGEIDFEAALRERIGLLKGFPLRQMRQVLDQRITLTPGAETLTATMRANGARCVLVSGGFTFFTSAVAKRAGFDADFGNSFIIANDSIAGLQEPILGQDAKRATLQAEAAVMGIGASEAIAVGDGANDLSMLKTAGLGVAFHAKPIVAREAAVSIRHGDLTSLLFLQGYRQDDFIAAS